MGGDNCVLCEVILHRLGTIWEETVIHYTELWGGHCSLFFCCGNGDAIETSVSVSCIVDVHSS